MFRSNIFVPKHSVIPGFGITIGCTLFYLGLIVLLPLGGLVVHTLGMGWEAFLKTVTDDRLVHAYKITFGLSFVAAVINAFFGLVIAWVLARYRFPGKRIMDALVDLPFAMPTAVSGIALAALYADNGWIGQYLAKIGIHVAFTPLGIAVALVFIGLPFVVRSVQPVLEDLEYDVEEAAATLGASRWQTFRWVILPTLAPSLLTGFAMAFARALGEYGSVIFIAGNMPFVSEIVPLIIIIKLEQHDYTGATAIAVVMLLASFLMLFVINGLQKWARQRQEG